ncbi:hypothetical protein [Lihuaxuella thermophila]|uniref:Uncharacterized protein n=1 Tax=Lihuaxuella thermophila TaxID=1173111 RepID=A0A1H8CBF8_9BACL|nr:hypothetical protein [Lihuaxuella thermophila]SEM92350.1 hypothetical protein SAMN05444955_103189 [Lihuaxuella thermophila]
MLKEAKTGTDKEVGFVVIEGFLALGLTVFFIIMTDHHHVRCVGEAQAAPAYFGLVLFGGPLLLLFFIVIMVILRRLGHGQMKLHGMKLFILVVVSQLLVFVLLSALMKSGKCSSFSYAAAKVSDQKS